MRAGARNDDLHPDRQAIPRHRRQAPPLHVHHSCGHPNHGRRDGPVVARPDSPAGRPDPRAVQDGPGRSGASIRRDADDPLAGAPRHHAALTGGRDRARRPCRHRGHRRAERQRRRRDGDHRRHLEGVPGRARCRGRHRQPRLPRSARRRDIELRMARAVRPSRPDDQQLRPLRRGGKEPGAAGHPGPPTASRAATGGHGGAAPGAPTRRPAAVAARRRAPSAARCGEAGVPAVARRRPWRHPAAQRAAGARRLLPDRRRARRTVARRRG